MTNKQTISISCFVACLLYCPGIHPLLQLSKERGFDRFPRNDVILVRGTHMHLLLKVENGCFVQLWLCSWEYRSVEAEREPDHVFIMITLLSWVDIQPWWKFIQCSAAFWLVNDLWLRKYRFPVMLNYVKNAPYIVCTTFGESKSVNWQIVRCISYFRESEPAANAPLPIHPSTSRQEWLLRRTRSNICSAFWWFQLSVCLFVNK